METGDRLSAQVRENTLKSALLVAGFPFVLPLVSFLLVVILGAGQPGAFAAGSAVFMSVLVVVVIATLIWLPIGYLLSQWIIDNATGARLVGQHEEPHLWAVYEALCRKANMRMPALRIIETEALNAFASGLHEGQYSVTVTRGLLNALDDAELEGVLAHEITHIRNQDCRLMVVAAILVGLVPLLHDVALTAFWAIVMGILNIYRAIFSVIPIAGVKAMVTITYNLLFLAGKGIAYLIGVVGQFCSLLIHYSLSRRREFMADAGAVEITGNPDAMISALQKVSCNSEIATKIEGVREMLFDSPQLASLFATHPPIEKRIEAIRHFADEQRRHGDRQPSMRGAEPQAVAVVKAGLTPRVETPARAPMRAKPELSVGPPERQSADRRIEPRIEAPAPPAQPAPEVAEIDDRAAVDGYCRLLLRAMDGKPEAVARETREALYRRARTAMMGRLYRSDPPLAPSAIARLGAALEDAIDEVEFAAEMAGVDSTRSQAS